MVETVESYKIVNLQNGICIEQEESKRLKTRGIDFNNIKKLGYAKVKPRVEINESPSYVEDESINNIIKFPSNIDEINNEPIKSEVELNKEEINDETAELEVESNKEEINNIIEFPSNIEKINDEINEPKVEEPKIDEVKEKTEINYGSHYEPTRPVPSITGAALKEQTNPNPTILKTSTVIDKINQPVEKPIKNDMDVKTFLSSLPKKEDLGPTGKEVLRSEIPSLDKIIDLLEKLKVQIEDLKDKKEEKEAKKQEVLDGSKSLEEFLGMTLTLDLTAIKNATKGIDGAGEAFEDFKKSVGKIQNAKSSSDETIRQIEEEIKQIEEDIVKTQKEIEEAKEETNNKCIKLQEDLKTATSLDEKEEAVNKQLDILRKQKEALTGTLPQYDPFANLRESEEETNKLGRAA